MHMNIALDGPVGAGKSSIADEVARRLSILHLDTGAMYRAAAIAVLRAGIEPCDEQAVTRLVETLCVEAIYAGGQQRTLLNGEDVTDLLRAPEVSLAASTVAKWPGVRCRMVQAQRAMAEKNDMLIDGRDIGTRVLPEARVKIFLTAEDTVRAQRRWLQLRAQGTEMPLEQVLSELRARDRQDRCRAVDPLCAAKDAILVDSTHLDEEQTVQAILDVVEAHYGKRA